MKTPEDEAFEEIERRQGGGFPAKRAMAADKLYHSTEARWCENFVEVKHPHIENEIIRFYFTQPAQSMKVEGPHHVVCQCDKCKAQPAHCQCTACKDGIIHASDCAVHNGPAYPAGPCDCGVAQEPTKELQYQEFEAWANFVWEARATQSLPAQEPVALVIDGVLVKSALPEKYTGHLYTTPPKRPWVGLTPEEILGLFDEHNLYGSKLVEFACAVEQLLKEKNG